MRNHTPAFTVIILLLILFSITANKEGAGFMIVAATCFICSLIVMGIIIYSEYNED